MTHANAALTPRHRLKVARLVVDDGWPISEVAARFQVSWPTVKRWVERYRVGQSMQDRSSRPHHSPNKASAKTSRRCIPLRLRLREGPVQLAFRLGIAPSTVHRILTSVHLNRLSHVDRATGEPIRRYEHDHPGSMLHVDVKKLGNIPDGGGWRYVGRRPGEKNRAKTPGKPHNKHSDPLLGFAYVHTVIDDHSRVAYAEIHDDETAQTATAVLVRAVEWFNQRGITVERVLSDNGGAYRSHLWRDTCAELETKHKRTRPYRPQTNGKIERFHRTLATAGPTPAAIPPRLSVVGATWLAALLQPSPTPHRMRQPAALLTIDQRIRPVQLGAQTGDATSLKPGEAATDAFVVNCDDESFVLTVNSVDSGSVRFDFCGSLTLDPGGPERQWSARSTLGGNAALPRIAGSTRWIGGGRMDLWVILVWGAILVVALVTCVLLVVRDVRNRRNRRRGAPSSEGDLSGADAIDRTLTLGVSQHVGGAGGRGGAGI